MWLRTLFFSTRQHPVPNPPAWDAPAYLRRQQSGDWPTAAWRSGLR